MPSGVRSNSLLVVATPSGLVRSLDEHTVDYLDRDGVPRRRTGSVDFSRRLVLRGSSLSSLDAVRAVYGQQDDNDEYDDDNDDLAPTQVDDSMPPSLPLSLDEKLALERVREAKMVRRRHMICEIHERKRQLLAEHNDKIVTRIQRWHDVLALDPDAELTSAHTALSPSSKARAFIDDDGNVRRKSQCTNPEDPTASATTASPKTAAAMAAAIAGAVAASPRKSMVLEFLQLWLED